MQRIKDLAINDSGFVFDPYSGATFSANAAALVVLDALRRGLGRAGVVDALASRFDASADDLARDVDDLVQSLRLYGLVPADFEVA